MLSIRLGTLQVFNLSGMIVAIIVLDINWRGANGPRFIDLEAHGVEVT